MSGNILPYLTNINSKFGFQLMADGRSSVLGLHAQNLVGLVLSQGQGNAPTQRLATVVTAVRAVAQKLQGVTHRNVQVNFSHFYPLLIRAQFVAFGGLYSCPVYVHFVLWSETLDKIGVMSVSVCRSLVYCSIDPSCQSKSQQA